MNTITTGSGHVNIVSDMVFCVVGQIEYCRLYWVIILIKSDGPVSLCCRAISIIFCFGVGFFNGDQVVATAMGMGLDGQVIPRPMRV